MSSTATTGAFALAEVVLAGRRVASPGASMAEKFQVCGYALLPMRIRFGSADEIPGKPRSVSNAPCRSTPSGRMARLNAACPTTATIAPTVFRAAAHKSGSTAGSQLTIIC